MEWKACPLSSRRSVMCTTTRRRNAFCRWRFLSPFPWVISKTGEVIRRRISYGPQRSAMAPTVQRWWCRTSWSSSGREPQHPSSSSRFVCRACGLIRNASSSYGSPVVLKPGPEGFLPMKTALNIHPGSRTVKHQPVSMVWTVCFCPPAGVLCGSVVFGWVLVLQCLYALHACGVWSISGSAADEEHVRNPQNGEQTLHDPGNCSNVQLPAAVLVEL